MSTADNKYIAELVGKCRKGDSEAWNELSRLILRIVFTLCDRYRLSLDEQFDIYGRVNEILLRKLENIKNPEKTLSYVWTISENEIRALQRENKQTMRFEREIIESLYSEDVKGPDEALHEEALSGIISEALAEMDMRCYDLLTALFFDSGNPSYEEIAKRLNMPVSSIGPNRGRCLKRLLKILKKKGFKF